MAALQSAKRLPQESGLLDGHAGRQETVTVTKCPVCRGTGHIYLPMNMTGRNESRSLCPSCRGKPVKQWEGRDE